MRQDVLGESYIGALLARQNPTGYPFFFPTLFGSGEDGSVTLTTNADVGYLGSYGSKQATAMSLAAGQTLTIAQGSSSGALMLACRGRLTIAGTITGDGANGGNATAAGATSGTGGATAGGGATASGVINANGTQTNPTKIGHGARTIDAASIGSSGLSGGEITSAGSSFGGTVAAPTGSTSSTFSPAVNRQMMNPAKSNIRCESGGLTTSGGTQSNAGTAAPVNPTTNDVGPWAQATTGLWLPRGFIPGGVGGFGGGCTADGSGNDAAGGGGGGGGGCIIFEADTIELVAGYSITLRGGNGGNGTVQGGTSTALGGSGGWGGLVLLICRTLIGSTAAINCSGGTAGTSVGAGAGTGLSGIAGGFYVIKV